MGERVAKMETPAFMPGRTSIGRAVLLGCCGRRRAGHRGKDVRHWGIAGTSGWSIRFQGTRSLAEQGCAADALQRTLLTSLPLPGAADTWRSAPKARRKSPQYTQKPGTTFQSIKFSSIEAVAFMMIYCFQQPSYEMMDSSFDRPHSLCLSRCHRE